MYFPGRLQITLVEIIAASEPGSALQGEGAEVKIRTQGKILKYLLIRIIYLIFILISVFTDRVCLYEAAGYSPRSIFSFPSLPGFVGDRR